MRSAVVAHIVVNDRCPVNNHRAVINVRHAHVAKVVGSPVIQKVVAMPIATLVARAHVAVPIIDAAIEADISSPVPMAESIAAIEKAPITWRPERALVRRRNPGSRHPVIAGRRIVPIARRPDVAGLWHRRLVVRRHRRWRLRCIFRRCWIVAGVAVVFVGGIVVA